MRVCECARVCLRARVCVRVCLRVLKYICLLVRTRPCKEIETTFSAGWRAHTHAPGRAQTRLQPALTIQYGAALKKALLFLGTLSVAITLNVHSLGIRLGHIMAGIKGAEPGARFDMGIVLAPSDKVYVLGGKVSPFTGQSPYSWAPYADFDVSHRYRVKECVSMVTVSVRICGDLDVSYTYCMHMV